MVEERRGRAAQLGADDVIRFVDGEHFLEEMAGNLGRGRALVRSRRTMTVGQRFPVEIEAPGAPHRVRLLAVVAMSDGATMDLRFADFEQRLETLDALGDEVERSIRAGAASVAAAGFEDNDDTGLLEIPPGLFEPTPPEVHIVDPAAGAIGPSPGPRDPAEPIVGPVAKDLAAALSAYLDVRNPPKAAPPRADTAVEPPEGRAAPRVEDRSRVEAEAPRAEAPRVEGPASRAGSPRVVPFDTVAEPLALRPPVESSAAPEPSSQPRTTPIVDFAGEVDQATADVPSAPGEASRSDRDDAEAGSDRRAAAASSARDDSPPSPGGEDGSEAEVLPFPGTTEPAPAVEPAGVVAEGVDALSDLPVPRMSPAGALRVTEPHRLLGLWLSGLADGVLTVLGGPPGDLGSVVRVKFVADRVVTVEATVRARVGPWLTVVVDDRAAVAELIRDQSDRWRDAVAALTAGTSEAPAAIQGNGATADGGRSFPSTDRLPEPTSAPAAAVLSAPSSAGPTTNPAPTTTPGLALGPRSGAMPVVTPKLPEPEDPAAPSEPPRLDGDRVLFRHAGDLRRELARNLPSGGLSALSAPLPLREKRRLVFVVGDVPLPVTAEATVVYTDRGTVGFSLSRPAEVCASLENLLHPREPEPASAPDTVLERGVLAPPLTLPELINLDLYRGKLGTSALGLFDRLVHERFRGVLRLSSGQGERTVYLHDGNVAFLETGPFDEASALGRILTSHKRLSDSALRDGLGKARLARRPLGRSLVALGLAKPSDVVSALREQTKIRLETAFEWDSGAYEIVGWRDPSGPDELVMTRGLGVLAHYLRQRLERAPPGQLERALEPRLRVFAEPSSRLDEIGAGLGMPPKELRFLQVSVEGRTLEEAIRMSPLGRLTALRLTALALGLGLIRVSNRSAPTSGPRPSSADDGRRLRQELEARLNGLLGQNHFEVLGVHWSSHHRAFPAAYEARLAEFSTVRGRLASAPADVQTIARRCSQRVKEAFEILSDEAKRVQYRHGLFDHTEREYAAKVLTEKGEVALMRGAKVDAIEHLETAAELFPTEQVRGLLRTAREGRR